MSFAIGSLLGAAFLEILPHAVASAADLQALFATVLAGILGFFVLEKLVLWRHYHIGDWDGHDHQDPNDRGRSGMMIIIGDGFHNFVDGILIAAAFLQSTELGVVTAAAIIAHEIPQEIGDFVVLLHSGYGKLAALALNLLSSLAMLVGALLAYFTLRAAQEWIGTVLALAAASMIYRASLLRSCSWLWTSGTRRKRRRKRAAPSSRRPMSGNENPHSTPLIPASTVFLPAAKKAIRSPRPPRWVRALGAEVSFISIRKSRKVCRCRG